MKFHDVSENLIQNGDIEISALAKRYNSSDDVVSFALKSTRFNLTNAVDIYRENGQMLAFEISMRNQIFNMSRKLLRVSVLKFGTLVDYIYLKEIEVFTLRALIKGKEYGLSKEDLSRLMIWNP
jgi:vacuolar-type H+-ATPase subunit C/Vma6